MNRAQEIAWAAGLFEGEGTMVVARGKYAVMALQMRDRDVVERWALVVGCGQKVRCEKRAVRNPAHSDIYRCEIAKRVDVRRVLTMFLPYLGERRAERARQVLAVASIQ
jgi:hypothetical protein